MFGLAEGLTDTERAQVLAAIEGCARAELWSEWLPEIRRWASEL
jgi:hypothetical protein